LDRVTEPGRTRESTKPEYFLRVSFGGKGLLVGGGQARMLEDFVQEWAAAFGCGVKHDDDTKNHHVAESEEKRGIGIQTGNDL